MLSPAGTGIDLSNAAPLHATVSRLFERRRRLASVCFHPGLRVAGRRRPVATGLVRDDPSAARRQLRRAGSRAERLCLRKRRCRRLGDYRTLLCLPAKRRQSRAERQKDAPRPETGFSACARPRTRNTDSA